MAEFCVKCWNRFFGENIPENKYVCTKELYLCEGCGRMKKVVIAEKKDYCYRKLRYLTAPFRFLSKAVYITVRILFFPYLFYKYRHEFRDYMRKPVEKDKFHFESDDEIE